MNNVTRLVKERLEKMKSWEPNRLQRITDARRELDEAVRHHEQAHVEIQELEQFLRLHVDDR